MPLYEWQEYIPSLAACKNERVLSGAIYVRLAIGILSPKVISFVHKRHVTDRSFADMVRPPEQNTVFNGTAV